MRRAGAAVLIAALLAVVGCGDTRVAAPVVGAGVPTDLPPFTEPGNGGAIELVDSGVATLVDVDGFESVGFGLLVANTGNMVATRTLIRMELLNDAGQVLKRESYRVSVLLPGRQFGIGMIALGPTWLDDGLPRLEVTISGSLWYPPDLPQGDFPDVTARSANVDYRPGCQRAATSFRADTSAPDSVKAYVASVIRDEAGAIVGGTGLYQYLDTALTLPPGGTNQELELPGTWDCPVPAGSNHDEMSVEVHLNPV